MIQAVLFDLDGTLLLNDMRMFMRRYLSSLSISLQDMIPRQTFVDHLLDATQQMVSNRDGRVTNQEAFRDAFDRESPFTLAELRPRLDAYYTQEFCGLADCTDQVPAAREAVEYVISRGREVVLATNPLFPLAAIQHRMIWAGVDDLPFSLVTSYENMHFCKPHPEYYLEIASKINVPPERCLMIGDDEEMDGPAVEAGMGFFWVNNTAPFSRTNGSMAHLLSLMQMGMLDESDSRGVFPSPD